MPTTSRSSWTGSGWPVPTRFLRSARTSSPRSRCPTGPGCCSKTCSGTNELPAYPGRCLRGRCRLTLGSGSGLLMAMDLGCARTRRRLALAGAVLLGLVLPPPGAGAAPPGPAPAGAGGPLVTVTLVTGDRVTLSLGEGRQAVGIAPARWSGRRVGFHTTYAPGGLRVVPSDVAHLVPAVLDPQLFDVTAL